MKSEIRSYLIDDKQDCLEAFRSNVPLYFTTEEVTDFELFLTRIDSKSENKPHYYVAVVDGKVVGCGGFGFYDRMDAISLAWGLIHQDYHKTGLGERLLSHRLQLIAAMYPDKFVVIDTTQHSYGFFEKFGFVTTKITLDFYTTGLHRYDMTLNNPNR